jgi:putative sterol carrier protein
MADIYTDEWYGQVRDAINQHGKDMEGLPEGAWHVAVDILGDGVSPYVGDSEERHFLIRIEGGHCAWYRELEEAAANDDPELRLDYRFLGPATVFDEIAAGQLDPIDAALHGSVKVRGDMRFLMRQAEHVKVMLEAYTSGVQTDWPKGMPPYEVR